MTEREQKALEIAARSKLVRNGDTWLVPSQSGPKSTPSIPIPNHLNVIALTLNVGNYVANTSSQSNTRSSAITLTTGRLKTLTETVTVKKTYKQEWSSYNKAQTNEKAPLSRFPL